MSLTPSDEASGDRDSAAAESYKLRLYVVGHSPASVRAIANLQKVCDEHLSGHYEVEVIDLMDNPRLAADEHIVAVPTLVKNLPLPIRRIVGDLSDTDNVLVGLQLKAATG